jgi:hypothetical protein
MKKIIISVAVIGLVIAGMSTAAMAVPLPNSGNIFPTGAGYAAGSTLIASTGNMSFNNAQYSGSAKEDVYSNSIGLLFVYNLTVNPSSLDAVQRMTLMDYDAYALDVDAFGPGDMPHYVTRTPDGGTLGFTFANVPDGDFGIKNTSGTMWVQTNAQYYQPGWITLQNGMVESLTGFQPATPEPASAAILGMGLIGFAGRLIKRKFKA